MTGQFFKPAFSDIWQSKAPVWTVFYKQPFY